MTDKDKIKKQVVEIVDKLYKSGNIKSSEYISSMIDDSVFDVVLIMIANVYLLGCCEGLEGLLKK